MSRPPEFKTLAARLSTSLSATLGAPRPLRYDRDAGPASALPAHVRAASAIRRQGTRLVILQDDVSALVLLDPVTGSTRPVLLPAGEGGARVFDDGLGNKKFKLDLEASVVLPDGRLLALGSGSSKRREQIATLAADEGASSQLSSGAELYASLRAHAQARDAPLNIEGAVIQGDWLRLLQRGNGKHRRAPWNAILDLALAKFIGWLDGRNELPPVRRILELDLGAIDGVSFCFTDAAVAADGRLAFLACAEDTADVVADGPVLGCRFGWLAAGDQGAVMTAVVDAGGQPTGLKLEGIESRSNDAAVFDVVADMDRADEPAQIAELVVRD